MTNFEVKHTVRLYDIALIEEISKTYESNAKEYRNKNEFMTELIRLGIKAMTMYKPAAKVDNSQSSTQQENLHGAIADIQKITSDIANYLVAQFNKLSLHIDIFERLLSSVYNMKLADMGGKVPNTVKVEQGFYDDLPFRFEKLLITLQAQLDK